MRVTKTKEFARQFHITAAASAEEAVRGADVIVVATPPPMSSESTFGSRPFFIQIEKNRS